MGKGFIVCLGCCIAAGFACEPAQAGDRKSSAARTREASAEGTIKREGHVVAVEHDLFAASNVKGARRSPGFDDASARQSDSALVSGRRKPITLFRFNTSLGEVAVQPVFGAAKGAQFSLGF